MNLWPAKKKKSHRQASLGVHHNEQQKYSNPTSFSVWKIIMAKENLYPTFSVFKGNYWDKRVIFLCFWSHKFLWLLNTVHVLNPIITWKIRILGYWLCLSWNSGGLPHCFPQFGPGPIQQVWPSIVVPISITSLHIYFLHSIWYEFMNNTLKKKKKKKESILHEMIWFWWAIEYMILGSSKPISFTTANTSPAGHQWIFSYLSY